MGSQISGSITFDTAALAGAVVDQLTPVMVRIQANLETLAGLMSEAALDEDEAVAALSCHLPGGLASENFPNARAVAEFQAEHLAQAGYALVAVNGPALEAQLVRSGHRIVAVVPPVVPSWLDRPHD